MNILVPIGGRDRYFPEGEYVFPKPLIDIAGTPLIEHTLLGLQDVASDQRYTFVIQYEDCRKFGLDGVLKDLIKDRAVDIVRLSAPTQGAVCSCLMALDHFDLDEELIVANSDQVIVANIGHCIAELRERAFDGGVLTVDSTHPRLSYIRVNEAGLVVEAVEKRVISRLAIAGIYYFRRSGDFIESAKRVLLNDNPVQGSFFISQVLNEMILSGKRLGHRQIPTHSYFPLYSPQKIAEFEEATFSELIPRNAETIRPVLVVPMAGEGARFTVAGYARPKPFIDVDGKTMIQRVLENLHYENFDTVLIARASHLAADPALVEGLTTDTHRIRFVTTDRLTEGAACTVLLARREIDREAPLLIANCDQIVEFDCREFINDCHRRKLDGSILVFKEPGRSPKWSYARTDSAGLVTEVREKVAISNLATVGLYYFAKGRYFIDAALDMIARNDRVNNEFYTCPVYNYLIAQGQKVGVFEVPSSAMHGLGVPADLEQYRAYLKRESAVGRL